MTGQDELIRANGLGLIYQGRRAKRKQPSSGFEALKNVSFTVRRGEFISLVGPSGCGKSTLLYILAGLIKKTSGAAYINGREIVAPALDRGIIMQAYALFPWRTVQKNVEFGLEIKKTPRKERREIAARHIELMGLSAFADRYPYELSGGMKQRIAIARALAYDPDLLLMDEPFAAVDEQTRGALHQELLRIWEKTNKTIIFVTHSIDEAILLSDRVAVMTPGPGTIKSVLSIDLPRPRRDEVKTTAEFAHYRRKIWQLLQNAGEMAAEFITESGARILKAAPQEVIF